MSSNNNNNNVKRIEFVCTANNGRSPLAEIVAKFYLAQICPDLVDPENPLILISSSGSDAEKIWDDSQLTVGKALFYIDSLVEYQKIKKSTPFSEEDNSAYEKISEIINYLSTFLRSPNFTRDEFIHTALKYDSSGPLKYSNKEINKALHQLKHLESNVEIRNRNKYLSDFGVSVSDTGFRRQTIKDPKLSLILTMNDFNLQQVKKIYSDSEPEFGIFTLPNYIGSDEQIPELFMSPDDELFRVYDSIFATTFVSMKKFIEENIVYKK